MKSFIRQACGQEPESFTMSMAGAFIVMFVFPLLVLFYGYVFQPESVAVHSTMEAQQ